MKKAFQKSISTVLALLVLFSTFSFTVDKHFCGDVLVDQAVFSEARDCGMEHPSQSAMNSEDGCSDQEVFVKGQKDLKMTFFDLDLDQQIFLASFIYTYQGLFEELPKQLIPFSDYSPPHLIEDIQILHETFLI